MHLTRRDLLKTTAIAGAGLALPGLGHAAGGVPRVLPNGRILVLVELDGGNDGLNTVVPYDDSNYSGKRPTLLYTQAQLATAGTLLGTATTYTKVTKGSSFTNVTRSFGLNPLLNRMMVSWNGGDLAIVLGVGYSQPNLSHFRSIDIWNSGSDSNQFLTDGWLGRVLANNPSLLSGFTADAVLLERFSSNPLALAGIRYLAMSTPAAFIDQSWNLRDFANPASVANAHLRHLLTVQHDVYGAAGAFRAALMGLNVGATTPYEQSDYHYAPPTFPGASPALTFNTASSFEMQCLHTAEMIATDTQTNKLVIPVYKLHLGGFDNHSGQKSNHEDLLAQLGSGLSSLRSALKSPGVNLWDRVVVMTYSEFGRRVEQNGSAGTDHGTANCHFIMGGKVQGGFYGKQPGLVPSDWNTTNGDLDERGNLIALIDYRHLYKKVVTWMGLTPDAALATPPAPGGGLPADPLLNLFKP